MPVRVVIYGAGGDFDPIRPDESDLFSFDFTVVANGVPVTGQTVVCTVDLGSSFPDPSASTRVLSPPTIQGAIATCLVGTMLDGVEYDLTCTLSLKDGRVLVCEAGVEADSTPLPLPVPFVLTPARFRQDFPVFTSGSYYPEAAIARYITWSQDIDPNRWKNDLTLGQELFVAHMLTLDRQAQLQGKGGRPNLAVGPTASRSVNGVSVSYDVSAVSSTDAGFWNSTPYGQRYWWYMQLAGMGPLQVI